MPSGLQSSSWETARLVGSLGSGIQLVVRRGSRVSRPIQSAEEIRPSRVPKRRPTSSSRKEAVRGSDMVVMRFVQ